jgi:predicted DNA-binding transcriptional regulator AlpA
MAATNQQARYLSPEEAAAEYGFGSAERLRRMARQPGGPPSLKIGNLVRFDRLELEAWMQAQHR